MKIVNKSNIPESIFNFLQADFYDGKRKDGHYSATELLKPVREIILTRRHHSEIEVDAIDRLWSLFGNGVHAILEKEPGIEPIDRMFAEVDGKTINGKFDRVKDGKLYDYKVTSAIKLVYNSRAKEWKEQLSIYRFLYWKMKGIELSETGYIIAVLRDWSNKELTYGRYPKSPIVEIPIPLMSLGNTLEFIRRKLKEIEAGEKNLPECTNEDRWYNAKKKVFNKCARYCPAFRFCTQANPPIFSEVA